MPPTDRLVPRFAAEPPQEGLPYGRWSQRLSDEFLAACRDLDGEGEDLGEPGEIAWHPDRTYGDRTYVPAACLTSTGLELFGYVSFARDSEGEEPSDLRAAADFTAQTAERNPDWKLDLCDETIGSWRGEQGRKATISLVWGRPLVAGGAIVTADLAGLTVDQCVLVEERFTLIAPDDYRSDLLEVRLFDRRGRELAREPLYDEDESR
ncbi:MAG: hypothetical protein ACJ76S_04725 [Solirubrobacteraceae bacterium]